MDHQPNYTEYTDPSYGNFSFSGSENYMIPQPEQLNGKTHCEALQPLTPFDPGNSTAHYNAQPAPMMFHHHLPDPMVPPPQESAAAHYPLDTVAYGDVEPSQPINVLKDPMFDMENPPSAVPANIIQQESITMQQTEPISLPQPEIVQDSQIEMTQSSESSLPTETEVTEALPSELQPEDLPSSPEKPQQKSVFSPEQNNMMKALGVVRKEVLAPITGSNKRRRRILQLNDEESDDESELKNEMELQISPEKEKESAQNNEKSEESESEGEKDPEAIKARSLLKSAVIIQGPASKKKKRVLDSDEEDEMQTSVDDIGLMDTNDNDNEDDLYNSDIIVSDAGFDDISEKVVSIENPIIPQDEFVVPAPPSPLTVKSPAEVEDEKTPKVIVKTEKVENLSEVKGEVKKVIKTEEGEVDPSMSVEAILENIKPMADDDEFFKLDRKSDDSDCQFVCNEDYFGTPDLSKTNISGSRKRGPKPGTKRKARQETGRRKRSNKYAKDNFVEGSSESEDTDYSESASSSSDSSCEEVKPRGRPPVKRAPNPIIVQTKSFSVTRVPIKKKITKKDRFYDKSRDIPNDIYFGDVKVPLHVLHTRWDSGAESSGSEEPQSYAHTKPSNINRFSSHPSSKNNFGSKIRPSQSASSSSYTYIEQNDDPKLSNLKEFLRISGIKINYARLFDGIRSTDDKCSLIRRILAQKGLQGEPTIAKCKQLRLDLQAKRESAELDKSVIIRAEGRTRRATRTRNSSSFSSQPSTSSAVVQPETLQTLSKIRRVVDSDSE